jgi:hypothetical protein
MKPRVCSSLADALISASTWISSSAMDWRDASFDTEIHSLIGLGMEGGLMVGFPAIV